MSSVTTQLKCGTSERCYRAQRSGGSQPTTQHWRVDARRRPSVKPPQERLRWTNCLATQIIAAETLGPNLPAPRPLGRREQVTKLVA